MLIVALLGRHRPGICNGIGTASRRILVFLVLAILTPPAQARIAGNTHETIAEVHGSFALLFSPLFNRQG